MEYKTINIKCLGDKYEITKTGIVRNTITGRVLKHNNRYGNLSVILNHIDGKFNHYPIYMLINYGWGIKTNPIDYDLKRTDKPKNEHILPKPIKIRKYNEDGIYWDKYKEKYRLALREDGKLKHIGYFKSREEAVEAHDLIKLEKEFEELIR